MRILVLGPNGQLGSDVVKHLMASESEHQVVPVARDALDVSI